MLLTREQRKHLVPDGAEQFKFVERGIATEEEKQKLRDLDAFYFKAYGYHVISNYVDIK